ncbi:MAG TPA: MMPL family transporter [Thermoanaerobaculia bacterium]|nr:MMPL family transporter [Thermoanaerobaculia bacterium]
MKTSSKRALAVTLLLITGATIGIPIAAYRNMEQERRARYYLGDRLYTEIRGSGDPVVFIAGLQGSTRDWGNAFDGLAEALRLYTIYIAQRFYENPDNLEVALGDTAKAVAMARLTALWGFGSFVTSHFGGMRSIGYASIVGIGLSGLAAITLPPAILVRLFGSRHRAIS